MTAARFRALRPLPPSLARELAAFEADVATWRHSIANASTFTIGVLQCAAALEHDARCAVVAYQHGRVTEAAVVNAVASARGYFARALAGEA